MKGRLLSGSFQGKKRSRRRSIHVWMMWWLAEHEWNDVRRQFNSSRTAPGTTLGITNALFLGKVTSKVGIQTGFINLNTNGFSLRELVPCRETNRMFEGPASCFLALINQVWASRQLKMCSGGAVGVQRKTNKRQTERGEDQREDMLVVGWPQPQQHQTGGSRGHAFSDVGTGCLRAGEDTKTCHFQHW